ncbi:MAG: thioredoxin [Paramuribaculum sp.]|nr:thioredoxin [Paramuribaculum sp.]MDE6383066.1 thioredoxin [Paramuribaculum sp.]MDE6783466.1 thioredoxin [Paramuribaculum sp.]
MAFEFTDSNVNDIIASGQPVVIDFWATWCGPCMRLAPVVDELAKEYEGKVLIGKYNVDEQSDLATTHRIMSIPTILFFKNGEQVRDLRMAGPTREQLKANIDKLLAL